MSGEKDANMTGEHMNTAAFRAKRNWRGSMVLVSAIIWQLIYAAGASAAPPMDLHYYLPDAKASRIVSVATEGKAATEVIILTEWVAKVPKIGEVYQFSPQFFAVRRGEPTMLTFWSLQNQDHDFLLTAPDSSVLTHLKLPPLAKTSYLFTFHKEGLYNFYCVNHPPEMNGQILVLPAEKAK
jgi:plastocyanin